jgi:hypothetical protein
MGADMFMEATGLPEVVYPGIERVIWEGRTLLSTVVFTARAEAKMPVMGEVLQVRKARIVGAQGHSGHGNFPRVIDCMASGMDMTPMSTKKISLEELPENIIKLQTDRSECKVTYMRSNHNGQSPLGDCHSKLVMKLSIVLPQPANSSSDFRDLETNLSHRCTGLRWRERHPRPKIT